MSMSDYVIKPGEIEKWALGRHVGVDSRLLVDGANLTVVYTQWEPGATAPSGCVRRRRQKDRE